MNQRVFTLLCLVFSFAPVAQAARDLELAVLGSETSTLESTVGIDCAGENVAPLRVQWPALRVTWRRSVELSQVSMVLSVQDPRFENGKFLCDVTPGEFDAAFGAKGGSVAGPSSLNTMCRLQCGGARLRPSTPSFQAPGAITILGTWKDEQGRTHAEQTSIPFKLEYHAP
jgi:hypothetical protein